MWEFVFGGIRVQLLSGRIVRVERMKKGKFCDAPTFFIPDRTQFKGYDGEARQEEDRARVLFGGYELVLPLGGRSLSGVRLERDGKTVWKYKRLANSGELPAPGDTPEVFALADTPRITVPEGGYVRRNRKNSGYRVEERVEDIYLLLCDKNAAQLRRLYVMLTGRCELVRLSTLGLWDSRYFEYDEESAKQRILDYEAHGVPLDNLVIDTDWRAASDRGIGYDVNTALFPDLQRFFAFAHAHGVEVMFNDHPEPVEGAKDLFDPVEVGYREEKLQGLMKLGLDTWWYDRNWHTKLVSPTPGVRAETFGLYLFTQITQHFYQKQARNKQVYRRPVVMGNVNNVANGLYDGSGEHSIHDSASHRYSIQWTGDIRSDEASLGQEVETLVAAGANCIPYLNADCGGHTGDPGEDGYIRWMQFGALSPVLRPHCTKGIGSTRSRAPWAYGDRALSIVREYIRMRYRMLPYLYALAHESYASGMPMCRALGFEYPGDRRACRETSEYLLGRELLVAPVARYGEKWMPLPRAYYAAPVRATYYAGRECKGKPLFSTQYDDLNIFLEHEPPHPGLPVYEFSARFETTLCFPGERELVIASDDGATVWIDGKKVHEDRQTHPMQYAYLGMLSAGEPHRVTIEYFQGGGAACIALGMSQRDEKYTPGAREVYLPGGRWINVFTGKAYAGGRAHAVPCPIEQMPLFVREGALIPLAQDARNTKQQSWSELAFDFYPSEEGFCEGALVEDDGETTAYQWGEKRTCGYISRYERAEDCHILTFAPAEGTFTGERACEQRSVRLRVHLPAGRLARVCVNGEDVPWTVKKRDGSAFPFSFDGSAPDCDVEEVQFSFSVYEGAEVRIRRK